MEDANTKVLLHFDGADGSTTFTDSAPPNRTWTAYGNAQIDTAQSKFGGASGYFDGTGDYIDTPNSADFNLGNGDFTIDFWEKRNSEAVAMRPISMGYSTPTTLSFIIEIAADGDVQFQFYSGSEQNIALSGGSAKASGTGWYHIAIVRSGAYFYSFVNGILAKQSVSNTYSINTSQTPLTIGCWDNGDYFNGWIDEFRLVKGVAKWTANFTPDTAPYSYGWAGKIFGVKPAKIFGVVPKKVCGI